jgi:hypothetical protein
MRNNRLERDDDSKKSHHALTSGTKREFPIGCRTLRPRAIDSAPAHVAARMFLPAPAADGPLTFWQHIRCALRFTREGTA